MSQTSSGRNAHHSPAREQRGQASVPGTGPLEAEPCVCRHHPPARRELATQKLDCGDPDRNSTPPGSRTATPRRGAVEKQAQRGGHTFCVC